MTKTWRTRGSKMSGKDVPTQLVKLESNFEEYPLGQLGKKPTGKPLSFNTKNVLEDGTIVEGEWTLIPSSEYHEPLGFDFDVYFAVAELVEFKQITDFLRIWDVTFDDSKKGGGENPPLPPIPFTHPYRRNFLDNYI